MVVPHGATTERRIASASVRWTAALRSQRRGQNSVRATLYFHHRRHVAVKHITADGTCLAEAEVMDDLVERIVTAVKANNGPLCERCLIADLGADHTAILQAMSGVAKLDDFQFRAQCVRCGQGWPALIVGLNAAP
jgi:hypothetical protein